MSRARALKKRAVRPARPPHRLLQATLVVALVALGFGILMVRLAVMRQGYRLSALRAQVDGLRENNRTLHLKVAELSSHQRLMALADKFRMGPPVRGQVVVVP